MIENPLGIFGMRHITPCNLLTNSFWSAIILNWKLKMKEFHCTQCNGILYFITFFLSFHITEVFSFLTGIFSKRNSSPCSAAAATGECSVKNHSCTFSSPPFLCRQAQLARFFLNPELLTFFPCSIYIVVNFLVCFQNQQEIVNYA